MPEIHPSSSSRTKKAKRGSPCRACLFHHGIIQTLMKISCAGEGGRGVVLWRKLPSHTPAQTQSPLLKKTISYFERHPFFCCCVVFWFVLLLCVLRACCVGNDVASASNNGYPDWFGCRGFLLALVLARVLLVLVVLGLLLTSPADGAKAGAADFSRRPWRFPFWFCLAPTNFWFDGCLQVSRSVLLLVVSPNRMLVGVRDPSHTHAGSATTSGIP